MKRRAFVTRLTVLFSGLIGLTACNDKDGTTSQTDPGLDASGQLNRKTLDALVDTFVPKDQDPGAVEAGVSDVLLESFEKNEDMKQRGVILLARVDLLAQHKHDRPFHRLELRLREQIIHEMQYSRREEDQSVRLAIMTLGSKIIYAFYLSPTGQAMLGYHPPYPRGYPGYADPPPV
ncbi:MAG: hypothetical protein BMS9Abin25_1624 [Gammaproteobacteria bacterium]|nr:MAG: hypothetical protein BMS9Abin25_1624 [Gammaproteobacteria bacterium]